MFYLIRIVVVVVSIVVSAQIGLATQPPDTAGDLISKFATDDFFATCYLRPNELVANEFFKTLSIDTIIPTPISMVRLKTLGVSELVVFAGAATGDKNQPRNATTRFELAAAARFSRPVAFDAFLKQWRHTTVPRHAGSEIEPEIVRIENHECLRVPDGTFLNPRRVYGELRFTDRQGEEREKGANIGDIYEYRSYIEGATKASAVYTLSNLTDAALINDRLPLEIRIAVFFTHRLEHEFGRGQITLRNPENDLCSEPISIEPRSYVNQELNIPRRLTAVDAAGKKREVDILKDLVSNGKLEIVFKGDDRVTYFGFGPFDVNLKTSAAEYVYVSDREIVVGQSPTTLAKMLRASEKPSLLAERLSQYDSDLTIVANVGDQSRRTALKDMINALGGAESATRLGESVASLTATMKMNEPVIACFELDLIDRSSAERFAMQVDRALRSLKQKANEQIEKFIRGDDARGALLSYVFQGIPTAFPQLNAPPAKVREQLQSIVDQTLAGVRVESKDAKLTWQINQPKVFSRLPKTGQFALAWLEEKHARHLFSMKRFDRGDEMYRRVTDRLPNYSEIWFRRAHHLSYNMSGEFDGSEARYSWVRRGIEVLLDGAELSMDTVDPLWMVGDFIAKKIGSADEHVQFRKLFSQDHQLHERLAKYVEIDKAHSPEQTVDNWLVAELIFQRCIDEQEKLGKRCRVPPLLFFSRPVATHAHYAESLDKGGRRDDAVKAWTEAERLYREFGRRTIEFESEKIKLSDFQTRLKDFGPADAKVKLILKARSWIQYDYWLTRCKIEQTAKFRSARKLSHDAEQRFHQSKLSESFELYRQSLQELSQQLKQQPEEMELTAHDFRSVLDGYRRVAKLLDKQDDESVKPILKLIENSKPLSPFPLFQLRDLLVPESRP